MPQTRFYFVSLLKQFSLTKHMVRFALGPPNLLDNHFYFFYFFTFFVFYWIPIGSSSSLIKKILFHIHSWTDELTNVCKLFHAIEEKTNPVYTQLSTFQRGVLCFIVRLPQKRNFSIMNFRSVLSCLNLKFAFIPGALKRGSTVVLRVMIIAIIVCHVAQLLLWSWWRCGVSPDSVGEAL